MSFEPSEKQKQLAEFVEIQNPHVLTGGGEAIPFRLYQAGAVMKVRTGAMRITEWRLVKPEAGTVHLWQGDDKPGRAFNLYGTSEDGADINERIWRFCPEKYAEAVERWERAVWCAQAFNKKAGTRTADVTALTLEELTFATELKKLGMIPMLACYAKQAETLCAMEMAEVHAEGYIYSRSGLRNTVLPALTEPETELIG